MRRPILLRLAPDNISGSKISRRGSGSSCAMFVDRTSESSVKYTLHTVMTDLRSEYVSCFESPVSICLAQQQLANRTPLPPGQPILRGHGVVTIDPT